MKKLLQGIIDFRSKSLADYREKFSKLVYGQYPDTLFIACCDSRVVPNTFASTDPGDLFVMRNIGNLVPPYQDLTEDDHINYASVAAVIEFSVLTLNVSDIVICGHSECAAMTSFTKHENDFATQLPFLNVWLKNAIPSYERFKKIPQPYNSSLPPHNLLSRINVIQQLEHLSSYPWVKQRLEANQIRLHGWWFDLATADIYRYDFTTQNFNLLDKQEAEKLMRSL